MATSPSLHSRTAPKAASALTAVPRKSVVGKPTVAQLSAAQQNASAALTHADRAYVLETGTVILDGTAAAIAGDRRVREAYLGE